MPGAGRHVRLRPVPGGDRDSGQEDRRLHQPRVDAIVTALLTAEVAHFDETGFRVAGKLAWVHSAFRAGTCWSPCIPSAESGHGRAGVLPAFTGIACHDAWAPYDSYAGAPGTRPAMRTYCGNWPRSPRPAPAWT